LGLRRQAQGAVKILADLPELTGLDVRLPLGTLLDRAGQPFAAYRESLAPLHAFMQDRLAYLLEQRGFDVRSVRAVLHAGVERVSPLEARRKLEALSRLGGSAALLGVATLLKRVKNISKGVVAAEAAPLPGSAEPADLALAAALTSHAPAITAAAARGDYKDAFATIALLQPEVAKFFDDVMVMAEDPALRAARLQLVARLRDLILDIADISEIVTES
jgi:glycyl-tRNA synthetase beta chain